MRKTGIFATGKSKSRDLDGIEADEATSDSIGRSLLGPAHHLGYSGRRGAVDYSASPGLRRGPHTRNSATPPQPITAKADREVVFCHQCEDEWYRDEHGLTCPRCNSDYVEICEPANDPRDFHRRRSWGSFDDGETFIAESSPFLPGHSEQERSQDVNGLAGSRKRFSTFMTITPDRAEKKSTTLVDQDYGKLAEASPIAGPVAATQWDSSPQEPDLTELSSSDAALEHPDEESQEWQGLEHTKRMKGMTSRQRWEMTRDRAVARSQVQAIEEQMREPQEAVPPPKQTLSSDPEVPSLGLMPYTPTNHDSGYASRDSAESRATYDSKSAPLHIIHESQGHKTEMDDTLQTNGQSTDTERGLYTTATIYSGSDTSSVAGLKSEEYVEDLATLLYQSLAGDFLSLEIFQEVSERLPDLLRAFALKLSHPTQSQIVRNIALFVHRNRYRVTGTFTRLYNSGEDNQSESLEEEETREAERADAFEWVHQRFLSGDDPEASQQLDRHPPDEGGIDLSSDETFDDIDDDVMNSSTEPQSSKVAYKELIQRSPEFTWILACLKCASRFDWQASTTMSRIRKDVLANFPAENIVSRRSTPTQYRVECNMDWDPIQFLQDQQYDGDAAWALEHAIVLTGSESNCQASIVRDYLEELWPVTGLAVLALILRYVEGTEDIKHDAIDGTEIQICEDLTSAFPMRRVGFVCHGSADSVIDVCQIFAWLSTALRTSQSDTGVATCTPYMYDQQYAMISGDHTLKCQLRFEYGAELLQDYNSLGQCWTNMFRNPVIAFGFPVHRRQALQVGLEMSLPVMSALLRTRHVQLFDSNLMIKSHSAMLIITKIVGELMMWHYKFERSGEYLPLLDGVVESTGGFMLSDLESRRHIIGWCSESDYYTGSSDACYDVEETCLPEPRPGAALEKLTIQGGKVLTFGVQIALGRKDRPLHMTSDSYISKLMRLESKYVVLWDDGDKRGWLVNAISAVLHLVRTRLSVLGKGDFASVLMLTTHDLVEASRLKHNSALQLLLNDHNRRLRVFADSSRTVDEVVEPTSLAQQHIQRATRHETQYLLFQDFAEQYCDSLDKAIAYQERAGGRNGIDLKRRLRQHLEGWDFMDFANGYDAHARVAALHVLGWSWVDFIRSIKAVVLFGRGFGDLILPRSSSAACSLWDRVPCGQYYLAASTCDLHRIPQVRRRKRVHPPELVDGLAWHTPSPLFKSCTCHLLRQQDRLSSSQTPKCAPVTVLYSPSLNKIASKQVNLVSTTALPAGAAVIFGNHISWKYRWRDNGQDDVLDPEPERQNSSHSGATNQHRQIMTPVSSSSQTASHATGGSSVQLSELSTLGTSVSGRTASDPAQQAEPMTPVPGPPSASHRIQRSGDPQLGKPGRQNTRARFLQSIKDRVVRH